MSTPVTELTETSTGRWIVTTRNGTRHLFDLDRRMYQRNPSDTGAGAFLHDGTAVHLTRIEAWPAIGRSFLIWFDEPSDPTRLEHWRQSSTVAGIEPAPDSEPAAS